MSHHTAEKLNPIKTTKKAVIANVVTNSNAESIAEEFSDRFAGLGKVQVEIHLDPDATPVIHVEIHRNLDVTPVIQPHRRIPFHLRQNDQHELQHIEDMDVIERVTQPKSVSSRSTKTEQC